MKTEHAIDWSKTAAEISDEYERMAIQCEQLRADLAAEKGALGRKCYENATLQADLAAAHKLQDEANQLLVEQARELAAAKAEISELKASMDLLGIVAWKKVLAKQQERHEKELAARDLVIKQLKDALDNHGGNYKLTKAECKEIDRVMSLQPTTEALDAYVQEQLRSIIAQNVIEVQRAVEQDKEQIRQEQSNKSLKWAADLAEKMGNAEIAEMIRLGASE